MGKGETVSSALGARTRSTATWGGLVDNFGCAAGRDIWPGGLLGGPAVITLRAVDGGVVADWG